MLKRIAALVLAAGLMLSLVGCGGASDSTQKAPAQTTTAPTTATTTPAPAATPIEGTVKASGSTALLPLVQAAKEQFEAKNAKVTIDVAGGGSFTGMSQVAQGAVDMGNSDVFLPAELQDKGLVDFQVAVAPFTFIVNKDVTVENLTQQQYIDIFTGKITNWKDVGGKDEAITIIHRAASSGSRATIKAVVLKGTEFTDKAVIKDSNGNVRSAIASTPGSIGYVDAPYVNDTVKALKYEGVAFSADAVTSGKYPVFAYEHIYTKGQPAGALKAFIDYMLSPEFQSANVEKLNFIPMSKMKK